jgi:hypothetical protein
MARGGYGSGSGVPLHARVRVEPAADSAAPFGIERPPYPARHCLVLTPVDGVTARPGLLVAWQRDGSSWKGRVVYVAELRAGHWSVVEEWLPSACLAPAGGTRAPEET